EIRSADESAVMTQNVPQSGPGRYELAVDAPRAPAFASLRVDGKMVDQIAVAGRYPQEFKEIGNDRVAMRELARRTGGEVIEPRREKPIDFRWPRRDVGMGTWLAAAGAGVLMVGLLPGP